jgi:radical SAM superfamily enzyme YgiQ (UPF0313 family)
VQNKLKKVNAKVSIINPDFSDSVLDPVAKRKFTPTSLAYSAAIFNNNGWIINFIEDSIYHYAIKELLEKVCDSDIVIVSTGGIDRWQCPPLEIKRFYTICIAIKKRFPKKIIISEGPHTTFNYEKISKYVNYVIYGEPEEVIEKISKLNINAITNIKKIDGVLYRKGNKVLGKKEKNPVDMTKLPIPMIKILPYDKYSFFIMGTPTVVLETSRGCFFNCSFCFKNMYGKGIRFKTIEQVLNEIQYCYKLGIRNFRIMDLDFTANKNRFVEICHELKKRNLNINWCCDSRLNDIDEQILKELSKSGCKILMFGIESLSKEAHKTMAKGIKLEEINKTLNLVKKYNIQTLGYFRFGYIDEQKQDIEETIQNAKKLNLDFISCEIFVPYPNTKFHDLAKQSIKRYSSDGIPLAYEKNLSYNQLNYYVKKFYHEFYFRSSYMLKHLSFLLTPETVLGGMKILFRRGLR